MPATSHTRTGWEEFAQLILGSILAEMAFRSDNQPPRSEVSNVQPTMPHATVSGRLRSK